LLVLAACLEPVKAKLPTRTPFIHRVPILPEIDNARWFQTALVRLLGIAQVPRFTLLYTLYTLNPAGLAPVMLK
jgi:hypothetical protein